MVLSAYTVPLILTVLRIGCHKTAFFLYDGTIRKLPCSVQDFVFEDFSAAHQPETYAGVNSEFNEITWFYASADSNYLDRSVTYNYLEKTWYTNTLARTTWTDYGVYQEALRNVI